MEAVIFLAGADSQNQMKTFEIMNDHLDKLDNVELKDPANLNISGYRGRPIECIDKDSNKKEIDLFHLFWGDLLPDVRQLGIFRRFFQSFSLLFYWLFSKSWLTVRNNVPLLFGSIISIVVIFLWVLGVGFLFLESLSTSNYFSGIKVPLDVLNRNLASIKDFVGWALGSSSVLMILLPVNQMINISYFVKCYFKNCSPESKFGKADEIRNCFSDLLEKIIDSNKYDKIKIVAHSFGAVVTIDVLSEFKGKNIAVDLITLGSPLKFLSKLYITSRKIRTIEEKIEQCFKDKQIKSWIDYYSSQDWLCSRAPVNNSKYPYTDKEIERKVSFFDQLNGESHQIYFYERKVMIDILS